MTDEQSLAEPNNTVSIEETGPCKKKVSIEIPEQALRKTTDEQYESLRREALVPGFRKGRAPRQLLEKRFGKEISEKTKLKLLSEAADSAIKENELDLLGEPDVDTEKIELPETGPLKFDFEVEVRPEFELPKLEQIPVKKTSREVKEEQIDTEIKQLSKYSGLWKPRADGTVKHDDRVVADVKVKPQDAQEEEKLHNIDIYVRPHGYVGGVPVENLDELLIDAKVGQSRETTTEVPKTYFKQEYRGKKIKVTIDIKEIKYLEPAAMDEKFLQSVGVKDEKELRERMRDELESRLEQQGRSELTEQIYQYMLDETKFDLPVDVVADQAGTLLQRQYISLMQRGLSRQQIDEQMDELRASSQEQAKRQLKTFFVMDKVADKLGVDVSEAEINGHIAQMAIQQGRRPEKLREEMAKSGSLAQVSLQVRQDKCISRLLESAVVTEVKPDKTKSKKVKKTKKAKGSSKGSKGTKKTGGKGQNKKQAKKDNSRPA